MNKNNILIAVIGVLIIAIICVVVIVALLMMNERSTTELPPTLDLETAVAEIVESFTATPIQPTNTPTEELTITPYPTRTPLPTATVTITPSPFPTRTPFPSITPTRSTQKPGEGLGDPTWIDEFETDDYWTLFDDECFKTDISGGKYIQTTKRVPAGACWEVTWPRIQDYYLETIARVPGGCEERDRYGIYFRGVDTQRGYLFGITCKGEYWLSFWNSKTSTRETLIDFTVDDKIKFGEGSANKLGIQTSGDRILLYVNDSLLAEVYDNTYTQKGLIGLFIGAEETDGFTVKYDYLAYWTEP
jgi:hypothetical protein